jgi:hypothetical protein
MNTDSKVRDFWITARLATIAIVVGAFIGCGGDEDGQQRMQSMVAPQASADSESPTANRVPAISEIALRPERPSPGRPIRAAARVTDPDGDATTVHYRWQTIRGRKLGEGATFDTSGLRPGSRLEVIATASDGHGKSQPLIRAFEITRPSLAISLVAIDSSEGTKPGVVLTSVVEMTNDDSGRADFELQWKVNGEVVGSSEELDTQPYAPGDVVVLRARANQGGRGSRFVSSPAVVLTRGAAPAISSKPLAGIEAGLFRYQIGARSEEPEARLTYQLLSGPDGMTVHEKSGLVQWRPTSDQRGRFDVEVSATDQWGSGVAQSFAIVADAPAGSPASPR